MTARMLLLALVVAALALPASAQAQTCPTPFQSGRYQVTSLFEFGMSCHAAEHGLTHYLHLGHAPAGFECSAHTHSGVTRLDCFGDSKRFHAAYHRSSTHHPTE